MSLSAQILVLAPQQGAVHDAAERLQDRGMLTISASDTESAIAAAHDMMVDAVLIDGMGKTPAQLDKLARDLKNACPDKPLPVVVVSREMAQMELGPFAHVMHPPVHGTQLAVRLQSALRLSIMEEEAGLRTTTLREMGQAPVTTHLAELDERPLSVLFTGGAMPQFIAMQRALSDAGADITAALTSFTAFDYLHERSFDVIVLNVLKENEPGFTIASAMRRNTRLFHVPAVMLVNPKLFEAVDEAFARGASDLVDPTESVDVAAQRILNLAHERRRREAVKHAFESVRNPAIIDGETSLFTASFFARHLARVSKKVRKSDRPLSLSVIRTTPPLGIAEPQVEAARRQFGGMLRHLVRSEDLAARLEPGVFAILMPGAGQMAAEIAAKRIEGVVECTAFEGGLDKPPFQLSLELEVLELKPRETPDHLLERARRK